MAVEKLFQEALALPREERERLLAELALSLAPVPDEETMTEEEWQAAWMPEIERRIRDVEEGRSKLIPAEEVMAELRARFRRS